MRVLPYLRVPVPVRRTFTPGEDPGPPSSEILTITFRLIHMPEKMGKFYDCERCRGAGLSSFPNETFEIPDDVFESMKIHVELCEGIKR